MKIKFVLVTLIALFAFSFNILCAQNLEGLTDTPPTITSVTPRFANAGSSVLITGTNFSQVPKEGGITFGNQPAKFNAIGDNIIIATVPPPLHRPSVVTITIKTTTSSTSASTLFIYPGPWKAVVLNSLNPNVSIINTEDPTSVPINALVTSGQRAQVFKPDGTTSYVTTTLGDVAVINMDTDQVDKTPFFASALPDAIAILPNGKKLYVVNLGDSKVSIFNTARTPLIPAVIVGSGPFNIAITPDGTKAFIPNSESNDVSVIDTLTDTLLVPKSPLNVPPNPQLVVTLPNSSTAYVVSNKGNSTLSVIDTSTLKVEKTIPFGAESRAIAITPDGNQIYLASNDDKVRVINTSDVTKVAKEISMLKQDGNAAYPTAIVISSDGEKVYVANQKNNTVAVINTDPRTTPQLIEGQGIKEPIDLALTPDGQELYVINGSDNTFSIFSTKNNTLTFIRTVQPQGSRTASILITPDQAPVAKFTVASKGLTATFNASESASPSGSIANYHWDFGDKNPPQPVDINIPTISHLYENPGTYKVTLTVTNSAGTSASQIYSYSSHISNFLQSPLEFPLVKSQAITNNGGASAISEQMITLTSPTGVFPPLSPPVNLKGFQTKNKFLTRTDLVNVLTWEAPSSTFMLITYLIYYNQSLTKLAGIVAGNEKLQFEDRDCKKGRTYKYYVVSVDSAGNVSAPAVVVVKGKQ